MQALKGLVAGMALLIVVGAGVLVWGLYQKATNPDFKLFSGSDVPSAARPSESAPRTPAVAAFGNIDLDLPSGCAIAAMELSANRLFLRIDGVAGCDRIVVVDAADGGVLGTISARR